MPPNPLTPWHDFALLLGTAAATLIGLLFVAASVGTSFFTQERQTALHVFLSPSLVHFCSVLAASLIALAPIQSTITLGALITATGLLGAIYAANVCSKLVRYRYIQGLDTSDRLWYAAAPAIGYAVLLAAGITLTKNLDPADQLFAIALAILLAAGIRNAWDITTWIVIRQ